MQTTNLRLILSWGAKPKDLDAYLVSFNDDGKCIVYHNKKNGDNCNSHNVTLNTDNTQSGLNGTEVISVDLEQYPEGRKYVYYIKDYTNREETNINMTWSDTNGRSIIYYPHHNPRTVYFNKETKGDERYLVVGCFDGPDFSNFKTVGKVTCCEPKSTDVCDIQVSCPSTFNTEAEIQPTELPPS